MTTPIITPMYYSPPERCPECDKEEEIKRVCAHCGYEYEEESYTAGTVLAGIAFIIGIIWLGLTVLWWFMGGDPLLTVLRHQWEWLTSLRLW
jgi:uncharacterized protein (DUF983 family)